MQQFLLNEKVIREVHMKTVDLKQRTKYAKKYDMTPSKPNLVFTQRNLIQSLLEKQRKVLTNPKNEQIVTENSHKTKHLLSTLKINDVFITSDLRNSQHKTFIKENCFTINDIKKNMKDLSTGKKGMNRTCSLVTTTRFTEYHVAPYDVNSDIRFKRSPRCFISPKASQVKKQQKKFHMIDEKENVSPDEDERSFRRTSKGKQQLAKMTIKQMVDKQIEQQIKKRRATCRTAPTKHLQRMNAKQQISQEYGFLDQDICKVQSKIYSQIRENRQKAHRRNKQRIGININRNKPFTSSQINKNTVKLLKKYNCDNMTYFSKFITKE